MPNHFSAVGLQVQSSDELLALADRVSVDAKRIGSANGHYLRWSSDIGAEIWLQVDKEKNLVGIAPFFEGKSEFHVSVSSEIVRPTDTALDGALYCWANPIPGEPDSGAYPFVFDAIDRDRYRGLEYPFESGIRLCAFAHELSTYASEEEFESRNTEMNLGKESFIPSGLFSIRGGEKDPPESEAIITGSVLDASILRNPLTGANFHWYCVRTFGGTIDMVCDPDLVDAPVSKGGVVSGSFWLCGRILKPRRRSFLGRLIRSRA